MERVFVGIDTDMCVLKSRWIFSTSALNQSYSPIAALATAGLQAHPSRSGSTQPHIGAQRLRDAGLGDGSLAAP